MPQAKANARPKPAKKTSSKAPATKSSAPSAGAFSAADLELPDFVLDMTLQSVDGASGVFTKVKNAATEAGDVMETAVGATHQGLIDLHLVALEGAKANSDATFAHLQRLCTAGSLAEVIELQANFAREQLEAVTEQVGAFQEAGAKFAGQVVEPAREALVKSADMMRPAS